MLDGACCHTYFAVVSVIVFGRIAWLLSSLLSPQISELRISRSSVPTFGLFSSLTTKPASPTAEAKSRTTGSGHFFSILASVPVWHMGVLEVPHIQIGSRKIAALTDHGGAPHCLCSPGAFEKGGSQGTGPAVEVCSDPWERLCPKGESLTLRKWAHGMTSVIC